MKSFWLACFSGRAYTSAEWIFTTYRLEFVLCKLWDTVFFHFDQGHLYHKIWLWNWNCYEKLWWWFSVMVSIVANLIVVIVLWVRRKRMKATHWFIVALALSDICFSLLLHPMLVATSFGSDSSQLFSKAGNQFFFKFRTITINYQKHFTAVMIFDLTSA